MQHTGLDRRLRPCVPDCFGKPLEPVTHHDADVFDATVLDLSEDLEPKLGTLTTVPNPQSQNVAFAIDGDPDGGVHRPVRDLPDTGVLTTMASMKITG